MTARVERPASRILLLDHEERVLLFRFDIPGRPRFWSTPGGAVDPGESYEQAARRELLEECGIDCDCGVEVHRRVVEFVAPDRGPVIADERYFLVRIDGAEIDTTLHTEFERQVVTGWRWFAREEIAGWQETIFPEELHHLLEAVA